MALLSPSKKNLHREAGKLSRAELDAYRVRLASAESLTERAKILKELDDRLTTPTK